MMKRPMPGMFAVDSAACTTQKSLDKWLKLAVAHALSLPPKNTRPAAKGAGIVKKAGK
jgi:hypothetical protein